MAFEKAIIEPVVPAQVIQQAGEQQGVGAGPDAQVQIGALGGGGPAWVDRHQPPAGMILARLEEALVEHRMAPGGIGADQHDQIGQFQILVAARHRVLAEGARLGGNGRGHAQP